MSRTARYLLVVAALAAVWLAVGPGGLDRASPFMARMQSYCTEGGCHAAFVAGWCVLALLALAPRVGAFGLALATVPLAAFAWWTLIWPLLRLATGQSLVLRWPPGEPVLALASLVGLSLLLALRAEPWRRVALLHAVLAMAMLPLALDVPARPAWTAPGSPELASGSYATHRTWEVLTCPVACLPLYRVAPDPGVPD